MSITKGYRIPLRNKNTGTLNNCFGSVGIEEKEESIVIKITRTVTVVIAFRNGCYHATINIMQIRKLGDYMTYNFTRIDLNKFKAKKEEKMLEMDEHERRTEENCMVGWKRSR
jgi:hypothetical protein